MGKYRRTLVRDIEKKQDFAREQENLKQKHKIETDKIIVEKSNVFKFTVKTLAACIRTLAGILVFILAAVGITALIYPDPRQALLEIGRDIYLQLRQYLPFLT